MTRRVDGSSEWSGLDGFDKLLEHRVRLGACVLLSRNDRLSFVRLRELLGETDGSLGAHLRKLEDEGYVTADKAYEGRKPVTWYALSRTGRGSLRHHLSALRALIEGDAAVSPRTTR